MSDDSRRCWSSTTRRTTSSCSPTCSPSRATRSRPPSTARRRSRRSPRRTPDLVLLDVMMPGLSGLRRLPAAARRPGDRAAAGRARHLARPAAGARQGHRGRRRRFPVEADQPGGALRARALAAAGEVAAGRSAAAGRRAEGMERQARGARRRAGRAARAAWRQLKRFFSPPVADAIVSAGEKSILAPHRREICYVFVDLRGFTAFTDSAEPEEVEAVLRDYHAAMGALVAEHEGTLDRFAGDGILIFFNDPLPVPRAGQRAARDGAGDAAGFRAAPRALAEARLRPRPRHRHRAGLRDARRVRLRGPLGLFGDRQRGQSRGAAVRRGRARPGADRPQDARGARRRRARSTRSARWRSRGSRSRCPCSA